MAAGRTRRQRPWKRQGPWLQRSSEGKERAWSKSHRSRGPAWLSTGPQGVGL
jgi:hypothetical protein